MIEWSLEWVSAPKKLVAASCQTCKFWDNGGWDGDACKRHAPVADPVRQLTRVWPEMPANGWCGDFEARHAPTS